MDRTVIGHISLSLDGRVSGPGGGHDMGWTVRHALTGAARAQLLEVTSTATTVLLDGPAGSSWSLAEATPTSSGALCLRYDLIRPAAGR